MAYQLRFESNAFKADSAIGKLLDGLSALSKTARKAVGIKVQEYGGDELVRLRGINKRTFQRAMDWADNDFDQQISDEKWDWKGADWETRRKNGQVVTEPRDIVDTSALLNSKRRDDVNDSVTEFEWTAPHAEGVHDGYRAKGGGEVPARPWTEETIQDLDEVINSLLKEGIK